MCAVGHVSRMCSGDVQLGALAKLQYCSFSMAKPKRLIRRGQASRPQGALSGGREGAVWFDGQVSRRAVFLNFSE
jgi:hypothetical protein